MSSKLDTPHSPAHITKRSWKYIFKRTFIEFSFDECIDGAASLTYYSVLATFPALVAIFSLLGIVGRNDDAMSALLGIISEVFPSDTADALSAPLMELARVPGAGIALFAGIAVALWSASGYVAAFSRVMNRIYGVDEGRPFWKLRPLQLLVTVAAVVVAAISVVALVVSGDVVAAVGNAIHASTAVQAAWSIFKWPILAVVVMGFVALLYYAAPNVKQPAFRWVSPGALLAIVVLILATSCFGMYVANFANYERTYGSLAGIVIFLLWLWIANLALLFGAEFDAELERGRQIQRGVAAEEKLRVQLRDTRQAEKRERKVEGLEAEGRRLRGHGRNEAHGVFPPPSW